MRDHGFHPVPVARVVRETDDAMSFVLDVPADLQEEFAYRAGQFVTFRLTIEGRHHLRSYSMSSSPDVGDDFAVTVKRVPGGLVSNWLCDTVEPGTEIETTFPAGVFCLSGDEGDIVAFAGGSGITPVFAIVKTALATTKRSIRLLYANRDADSVIFDRELCALAERHPGRLHVVHHLDRDDGFVSADDVHDLTEGVVDPDHYVCGPGPFMDIVESALIARGAATGRIHIERFVPADTPTDAAAPTTATTTNGIEVTIELDGRTETTAHRAGTTILQTARQVGMSPPFSCEAGNCATCMARCVEGEVNMFTNNALTDDEVAEGWILTCQSVPTTPTVHVVYEPD
jgi:ferredoxin-NADP reductase